MNGKTTIGETLRNLRLSRGFTQKSLSAGLAEKGYPGISDRKIQTWETGERNINVYDLRVLARFYGVTADYIIGLSDAPTIPDSPVESDIGKDIADSAFKYDERALERVDFLLSNIRNAIIKAESVCDSSNVADSPVIWYYYFCNALLWLIVNKDEKKELLKVLNCFRDYIAQLFSGFVDEDTIGIIRNQADIMDIDHDVNTICGVLNSL